MKTNTARVLIVDDSTPLAERVKGLLERVRAPRRSWRTRRTPLPRSPSLPRCGPTPSSSTSSFATAAASNSQENFRRQDPGVLVIMLTNHAGGAYRYACALAGADHFFDKSTEFESVAELFRLRYRSSLEGEPS